MKQIRANVTAVFGAAILVIPSAAFALPSNEIEMTYYRDANHDHWVGSRIVSCSGHIYREGTTSHYYERVVTPCNSATPLPEAKNLPCEFLRAGCGNLPRPH